MKNILLRTFQILSIVLLFLLALSTFIPIQKDPGFLYLNRFYDSPLNLTLWIALAVIMIVAVLFKGIRNPRQRLIHLALALIIVLFVIDKSGNERFYITVREGGMVNLLEHINNKHEDHDVSLELKRFEIDVHDDELTPKAYRSYLRLNDDRDVVLAVNKPLKVGRYRLYQSAFEKNYYFDLQIESDHYELTFGDTVETLLGEIVLDDYNRNIRHFRLIVGHTTQWLPINASVEIDGKECGISSLGERFSSVIEVVEVRGLFWLLVAGLVYLVAIAWDFWKPKKSGGKE